MIFFLVEIFSALVHWITCKSPYLQTAVKMFHSSSLEHGLGRGAFCDCFGSLGADNIITYFIWSPFLPAVLVCFGMVLLIQNPSPPPMPPRSLSSSRAVRQDRHCQQRGKFGNAPASVPGLWCIYLLKCWFSIYLVSFIVCLSVFMLVI